MARDLDKGYDNVKKKFIQASITNHVGSDILVWEGSYDSPKTITFSAVQEIAPGMTDEVLELFIIQDKDHYTVEYYHKEDSSYVKDTEVKFTRI